MLVEFGDEERQAQCLHCHRRSPVLWGQRGAAVEALVELGWRNEDDSRWRCPVCRDRLSGQFRIVSR